MDEKINWPLAGALTAVGAVTIVGGLALGGFEDDVFSGLLIEVGAGIGLVGTVVLLERRLIGRIGTAATVAATETVRAETAELQERIVRLENLDAAQEEERERRHTSNDATIQRVLKDELSAESVGDLLLAAIEDRLIVDDTFGVRTSNDPNSAVLYLCVLDAANSVGALWLDFQPIWIDDQAIGIPGGQSVPVPRKTDSIAMWVHDDSAAEIASELEAGLERTNQPANGFNFGYALTQLATSIEIMRTARAAPADSPKRLEGQLVLLINDHWAITDAGLESLSTSSHFKINRGVGGWIERHIRLPADFDDTLDGWEEAEAWLTDREGVTILRGDEEMKNTFAEFAEMARDQHPEPGGN